MKGIKECIIFLFRVLAFHLQLFCHSDFSSSHLLFRRRISLCRFCRFLFLLIVNFILSTKMSTNICRLLLTFLLCKLTHHLLFQWLFTNTLLIHGDISVICYLLFNLLVNVNITMFSFKHYNRVIRVLIHIFIPELFVFQWFGLFHSFLMAVSIRLQIFHWSIYQSVALSGPLLNGFGNFIDVIKTFRNSFGKNWSPDMQGQSFQPCMYIVHMHSSHTQCASLSLKWRKHGQNLISLCQKLNDA